MTHSVPWEMLRDSLLRLLRLLLAEPPPPSASRCPHSVQNRIPRRMGAAARRGGAVAEAGEAEAVAEAGEGEAVAEAEEAVSPTCPVG